MEQNVQAPSYRKTIPLFRGELKTLYFSEVNRFFKDLKDTFVIQASTYREWVSMVHLFFKDIMLRYEFLTVGLDPRLIPNIEDKDTGLVSIILSRMQPFYTAKTLHDEFFYEFRNKNRGYTLPEYIAAFKTRAEVYVQFARDAQAFSAVIKGSRFFASLCKKI
jgi:hypothetical protein